MPESEVHSTRKVALDPQRKAAAVIDALLHGLSLEEIAAKCAGGSIVRILQIISDGMSEEALRNLLRMHEIHCGALVEHAKLDALRTLISFTTGEIFSEAREAGPLTTDDLRILELRRRACVSILRLNPLPTRRDSYSDSRLAGSRCDTPQAATEVASTVVAGAPNSDIPLSTASLRPVIADAGSMRAPAMQICNGRESPRDSSDQLRTSAANSALEKSAPPPSHDAPLNGIDELSRPPRLNRAARRRLVHQQRRNASSTPSNGIQTASSRNGHPP